MDWPCPQHLNLMVTGLFTYSEPQSSKGSKPTWLVGWWSKTQSYEAVSGAITVHPPSTKPSYCSAQLRETWSSAQPGTLGTSTGSAPKPVWMLGLWLKCTGYAGNP